MKSITLVTGATGFIGKHFVKRLVSEGRDVRCLVRQRSDTSCLGGLKLDLVQGDMLDSVSMCSALGGVDVVYHLAGIAYLNRKNKELSYFSNVIGARNLARCCLGLNIRKIVYLSSLAAAVGPNSAVVDENTSCNPITRYGRSKLEAEKILIQHANEHNLPVIIVRAPLVYGPGQPPLSRTTFLFRSVLKKRFCGIGDGSNLISLCYIDNLLDGMLLAEECGSPRGAVYFISDIRPYTLREIVYTIAKEGSVRLTYFYVPSAIASMLVRFLPHSLRKLTREMMSNWACDISKAKVELGYRPLVDIGEGVKRTVHQCSGLGEMT